MGETPASATTFKKLLTLERDNVGGPDWWAQINGDDQIVLCQQVLGNPPTGKVVMSRRDFKAMCEWYLTGTWRERGGRHE